MKKVIGLMMVLVMVFMVMVTALADNPKGYSENEIHSMLVEWINDQYGREYFDRDIENGVYYTYGVLNGPYVNELTGKDYITPEVIENLYYDCKNYGYDWDVMDASVKLVGFYEGYDVYTLTIKTNTVPLGTYCEEEYYNVNLVFMVYEEE